MTAAVCSVYLLDEDRGDLVLDRQPGPESRTGGAVRLKLGEGLTGLSLKELRPHPRGCAAANPRYKHVPGLERRAVRVVPRRPHPARVSTRIGVLVVQDPERDYFTATTCRRCRPSPASWPRPIENAHLLMSLSRRRGDGAGMPTMTPRISIFYKGVAARPGLPGRATVAAAKSPTCASRRKRGIALHHRRVSTRP